jgi:predicted metal-dependent enzyme (double-stranded beta helix superfamily)
VTSVAVTARRIWTGRSWYLDGSWTLAAHDLAAVLLAAVSPDVFAIEPFVAECQVARGRAGWPDAIAAILRRAIERPDAIALAISERGISRTFGFDVLLQSPDLTIVQIEGPAGLLGPPHDHATVAVVATYAGTEGYREYRREGSHAVEMARSEVRAPDVSILPTDLVHAIDNTTTCGASSLHVYGNSHFDVKQRRLWNPWTFEERAFGAETQLAWTRALTKGAVPDRIT